MRYIKAKLKKFLLNFYLSSKAVAFKKKLIALLYMQIISLISKKIAN